MMIRARLLLTVLLILATMFLANCSPYSCRVTFGSSTCTPSGSGIGGGGGGGGAAVAGLRLLLLLWIRTVLWTVSL